MAVVLRVSLTQSDGIVRIPRATEGIGVLEHPLNAQTGTNLGHEDSSRRGKVILSFF